MRPLAFAAASLLAVLPLAAPAMAQSAPVAAATAASADSHPSLLTQVPADAQLCVVWNALENPGYAGSNWEQFNRLSQRGPITVEALTANTKASLTPLLKDAHLPPEWVDGLSATLATATVHGGALYVRHFEINPENGPLPPVVTLLVYAPKEGAALLESWKKLLGGEQKIPVTAELKNDVLRLCFNLAGPAEPWTVASGSLAANPRMPASVRSASGNQAAFAYVDAASLVLRLKAYAAWEKAKKGRSDIEFEKLDAALGLSNLKSLTLGGGFTKDGQWQWNALVEAPAPRQGALAMMDGATVSSSLLKRVPASADGFTAIGFDVGGTLDAILALAAKEEPNARQEWDKALAGLKAQMGLDIPATLAGLGTQWVAFSDPMATGGGIAGTVIISPLRNGAAVENTLTQATSLATLIMKQQMAREKSPFSLGFLTDTLRGVTIQRLGIPLVSPGYAIHDNTLYAALLPQAIQSAVRPVKTPLIASATYQTLYASLVPAGAKPRLLSYADLPRMAPHTYGNGLLLNQWGLGLGEMMSGQPSPMELPVLSDLLPILTPAMSAAWTDAQGMHFRSQSPFPGATLVAGGIDGLPVIATGALAAGILVPVLGVAKKNANVMKVGVNASNVGMGAEVFATSNKDYYPGWTPRGKRAEGNYSGLTHLLLESAIAPAQITSLTGNTPACPTMDPATGTFRRGTPEDFKIMDAWIRAHSSVIFIPDIRSTYLRQGQPVPAIRSDQNNQRIMAFIDPGMAIDPNKLAVVRGDTATTTESKADLDQMLKEQYGATSDELAAEFRAGKAPPELPAK